MRLEIDGTYSIWDYVAMLISDFDDSYIFCC